MYRFFNLAKYKAVFVLVFALVLGGLFSQNAFATVGASCTQNLECGASEECTGTSGSKKCTTKAAATDDIFGTDAMTGKGEFAGNSKLALGQENLQVTASKIINVALGLLGIVSVVIILIGGFKWMTAGGNDEQVGEARKWIFSGIIGLAIILSAWAIAKFVLNNLGKATGVKGFVEI